MDVRFTIGNKHLLFLITFISLILALSIVTAYDPLGISGTPSVMGHSVDEMDWSNPILSDVYLENTLNARNGIQNDGSADSGYVRIRDSLLADSWLRTSGSTGWYSQSYGGGWYMSDSTWIRSYGDKNIYHNTGILRTDGTLQVGSSGSRFVVNTDGRVGIGVSPTARLHVGGTPGVDGIRFPDGTLQTSALPSGVIVMWSGTLATIPAGWALCDGTSGTPNLRDRFIYGTSTGQNPGPTGGSTSHTHSFGIMEVAFGPNTGDTNVAGRLSWGTGLTMYGGVGGVVRRWTDTSGMIFSGPGGVPYLQTQASGVTGSTSTLPRYYKLAFIMKL